MVNKIGIVGAGFSGTSFIVALAHLTKTPLHLFLFEKTDQLGKGDAYRTPYPFHLLNVKAEDMSVLEPIPAHFVAWLKEQKHILVNVDPLEPLEKQFIPRCYYGEYLQAQLNSLNNHPYISLTIITDEVIDILPTENHLQILTKQNQTIIVNKVVLAMGQQPIKELPFVSDNSMHCINAWDYQEIERIKPQDDVVLVGTGLSMIDAVLSLQNRGHQGVIHAVSRHGLLPLPHGLSQITNLPNLSFVNLRDLMHQIKKKAIEFKVKKEDWRNIVQAIRLQLADFWNRASLKDKKRFMRHIMPYWNVHRHRVPQKVAGLLRALITKKQLNMLAGRIKKLEAKCLSLEERKTNKKIEIKAKWLINCIGPSLSYSSPLPPLMQSLLHRNLGELDSLKMGFVTNEQGVLLAKHAACAHLYALGTLRRGMCWEISAVPDIRKHNFIAATHLLKTLNVKERYDSGNGRKRDFDKNNLNFNAETVV